MPALTLRQNRLCERGLTQRDHKHRLLHDFFAIGAAASRERAGLAGANIQGLVGANTHLDESGRERGQDKLRGPAATSTADESCRKFSEGPLRFGLFDLAGNVTEWCLDDYDASYYAWSPAWGPFGPVINSGVKVLRGGAWNSPSNADSALSRSHAAANQAYTGNGCRIVREIP